MKLRKAVKGYYKYKGDGFYAVQYFGGDFLKENSCIIKPCYPEADSEGWIPTKLRKPTRADANKSGYVLVQIDGDVQGFSRWKDVMNNPNLHSYWQPAPRPPKKERSGK